MRTDATPSRALGIAATATTLVAILAMASTSSIVPAVGSIPLQARALPAEAPAARAVAAVVAAVARDLIDHDVVVMAVVAAAGSTTPADSARAAAPPPATRLAAPRRLGLRLLDLPPPIA